MNEGTIRTVKTVGRTMRTVTVRRERPPWKGGRWCGFDWVMAAAFALVGLIIALLTGFHLSGIIAGAVVFVLGVRPVRPWTRQEWARYKEENARWLETETEQDLIDYASKTGPYMCDDD